MTLRTGWPGRPPPRADTSPAPAAVRPPAAAPHTRASPVWHHRSNAGLPAPVPAGAPGQGLHGLGQFPQHALLGRTTRPALQGLLLRHRHERRQMQQPAWSIPVQQRHQTYPHWVTVLTDRGPLGNGRYASPEPWCSMHCPRPIQRSALDATWVTKASTSVVLPIPTSPVMHTTCRRPWHAATCHWCNCANSASRPTRVAGEPTGRHLGNSRSPR